MYNCMSPDSTVINAGLVAVAARNTLNRTI